MEPKKKSKQVLLRLNHDLWLELKEYAEAEFRSINGQIEYLLHQAIKKRKGK